MPKDVRQKTIGIIGGGWYGCHLALALTKLGYKVTVLEKKSQIFSGISGKFGVRAHTGLHYLRADWTRQNCFKTLSEFQEKYPSLLNHHAFSIYALGKRDANNNPSKVDKASFDRICKEYYKLQEISLKGYKNLLTAINIEEPSIAIGKRLRNYFKKRLRNAKVRVSTHYEVRNVENTPEGIRVSSSEDNETYTFDHVINATGYSSLLPKDPLPLQMDIVYQPCLALIYEDLRPGAEPFSFIIMDGWFPCIMPYDTREKSTPTPSNKYIMTHGKWTILGSYSTPERAQEVLDHVKNSEHSDKEKNFIMHHVKPLCEKEIHKFWPEFSKRFKHVGWVGSVIAKIKTDKEFRSAVTFRHNEVMYVIPGKVTNIFDAEREVTALLRNENVLEAGKYQYVKGGTLSEAMPEISEKPKDDQNTCELQPYKDILPVPKMSPEFHDAVTQPHFEKPEFRHSAPEFYPTGYKRPTVEEIRQAAEKLRPPIVSKRRPTEPANRPTPDELRNAKHNLRLLPPTLRPYGIKHPRGFQHRPTGTVYVPHCDLPKLHHAESSELHPLGSKHYPTGSEPHVKQPEFTAIPKFNLEPLEPTGKPQLQDELPELIAKPQFQGEPPELTTRPQLQGQLPELTTKHESSAVQPPELPMLPAGPEIHPTNELSFSGTQEDSVASQDCPSSMAKLNPKAFEIYRATFKSSTTSCSKSHSEDPEFDKMADSLRRAALKLRRAWLILCQTWSKLHPTEPGLPTASKMHCLARRRYEKSKLNPAASSFFPMTTEFSPVAHHDHINHEKSAAKKHPDGYRNNIKSFSKWEWRRKQDVAIGYESFNESTKTTDAREHLEYLLKVGLFKEADSLEIPSETSIINTISDYVK